MPRPRKTAPNRADGLYEVKKTVGTDFRGKAIRKSFYSSISLADAHKRGDDYITAQRAAALAGEPFVEQAVSFQTWAKKWLETYKKGKVKDITYESTYRIPVEHHLIPYFKAAPLDAVKPVDIQAFFNTKESCSLESQKKMRVCLRAIFDTALENGLCRKNPVTKSLKLKSTKQTTEKRTYTQTQYDIVHTFAKTHPHGLHIRVLLETGISRSELLGLRWKDFDDGAGLLRIRQGTVDQRSTKTGKWETVSDGLKNAHRSRDIPLYPELVSALKEKPRAIDTGGNVKKKVPPKQVQTEFIFHSPTGGAYSPKNWVHRVYETFMLDLQAVHPDIPALNPHELRHTRATLWKDDGVDLFSIAKLLGHSDLDMLAKIYAHDNIDTLKKALGIQ